MKTRKKVIAAVMIGAITAAAIPQSPTSAAAASVETGVSKKAYSLSKKAGTYTKSIKIKLRANSGYFVYYSKSGSLTKNKVIKSGQSKTFTISKTTTLTVYASKTAKTTKQLKTAQAKNAAAKYVYKIKTASTDTTQTDTTGTADPAGSTDSTASGSAGNTGSPNQPASGNEGDPDAAQNTAVSMAAKAAAYESDALKAKAALKTPATTSASTPVITCSQTHAEVSSLKDAASVAVDTSGSMCTVTIKKAGTYLLTGGSESSPAKNISISVAKDIAGDVDLVLDSLFIDNSALGKADGEDTPVIGIEKGTKKVTVTLQGTSSLIGNSSFAKEPASGIIYAADSDAVLTMLAKDASARLSVTDRTDPEAYGKYDPSDGIFSKGTLILQSGIYNISVNGDCLKGSGSDGAGGIMVLDGSYQLKSQLGNGMKSKNGTISIYGGTVSMSYTAQDGINAKNAAVQILGGDITIGQCYGDGIQGENVLICGDDTKLAITTCFADAGKNFYDPQLGSGNYNTLNKTQTTKTEVIHVDTGSHKGIKAGTKACTYSYQSVASESSKETGKTYTTQASGGIIITGGQIKVNTAGTGIKYNGSTRQDSNLGGITPANNDGQYIIGSPEDTVHSNNDFLMTGGTLELTSADDGITAQGSVTILNDSVIDILDSYEGIEGKTIIVGSTKQASPRITISSNDDGVNAASDASLHYDYTDESEEACTKIKTASSDNTFYMLDGYLNIRIADDNAHTFSLPTADGSMTNGSFTANGDGIDCNGSFYAYGGTVIVYGTTSNDNSPIDTDAAYYIGSGVTILATGSGGMTENPTGMAQAAITYGGMGGGKPGNGNENEGAMPGNGNENKGAMPGSGNGNEGAMPGNGNGFGTEPPAGMDGNAAPPANADGNEGNMAPPNDQDAAMNPPNPGMPNMPQGQMGASLSVSAGTSVAVLGQDGNTVVAFQAPKSFGYLFYSSPKLAAGSTYTISSGGSVGGTLVYNECKYDYRYTSYQAENATDLATVTASR
ncbi:MAG: carbohydrate-binding domain-containing protein [Eubacterium sp.]|nr:carbohydrate-binding domain-containing protein [Eubacterium sp.]